MCIHTYIYTQLYTYLYINVNTYPHMYIHTHDVNIKPEYFKSKCQVEINI